MKLLEMSMTMNSTSSSTSVLHEDGVLGFENSKNQLKNKDAAPKRKENVRQLVWRNIIVIVLVHLGTIYGTYIMFVHAKFYTFIFTFFYTHVLGGIGITAGAHRLWAHRCYKATWQLRLILMIANTIAVQGFVIHWSRDHRAHHKFSDTNGDPHNSKRGFFFCHMGWLCVRKHPELIEKTKCIDVSDLENDPILAFQKKHYLVLMVLLAILVPIYIPVLFWNETVTNGFFMTIHRYGLLLNTASLVNSVGHMIGNRPYDKNLAPSENWFVSLLAHGEGWHNYHHAFPWDYKTSELPYMLNLTTAFIDFFAWVGWAYDLKTTSPDMIKRRIERTGDGSHPVWGWQDDDQSEEERKQAVVYGHPDDGGHK